MSNNESIKDTLDVIRRALEDKDDFTEKNYSSKNSSFYEKHKILI